MSTFVIVPGAWDTTSTMEPLLEPLESAGHEVIVVDLPCDEQLNGPERDERRPTPARRESEAGDPEPLHGTEPDGEAQGGLAMHRI